MFNSIRGTISGHDFPHLYLQAGDIEWSVEVSAATFQSALASDRATNQRVYLHLHVREDALQLFGFWSVDERTVFSHLLKVSGIGPRQALRILSGTTVPALTEYLEQEDVDALTRIPGLGKKTAQKMILQLRGSLASHRGTPEGSATVPSGSSPIDELLGALEEMGFDRSRARASLEQVSSELDEETLPEEAREQELFRRAIVRLSGSRV